MCEDGNKRDNDYYEKSIFNNSNFRMRMFAAMFIIISSNFLVDEY